MKQDNLDVLFDTLKNKFDVDNPKDGHRERFMAKLNNQQMVMEEPSKERSIWKPFIGIAASILLLITIFIGYQGTETSRDLASISPEMAATQEFFTTTIETELSKLNVEENPEFQDMIVDALFQIEILEQNYEKLKVDLDESGEDKLVIYAMIDNFQNRIDILQNVLESIEELKQNEINNENSSTL